MKINRQDTETLSKLYNKVITKREIPSQLNEAMVGGSSDPDITVWTSKGEHNYDNFLAANEDRIGKPMIDGGLAADSENAEAINGQPNNDVIYCGSGCVVYMRGNEKIFIKLPSQLINIGDGTTPWSSRKSYDSENIIIKGKGNEEFNAIVNAVNVAAKF